MEHRILELEQEIESQLKNLVIYKKDNNLDRVDNLDTLPVLPAVYAICGRVNNKPANARYIGECENLQHAVKGHFDKTEPHECLRNFMQAIKIKELVYILMPNSSKEERASVLAEWILKYKPECNEELNEIH